METNKEEGKVIKNDLLDKKFEDVKVERPLDEEESSTVSTNLFSKDTGRKNKSFGPGHEPGGA